METLDPWLESVYYRIAHTSCCSTHATSTVRSSLKSKISAIFLRILSDVNPGKFSTFEIARRPLSATSTDKSDVFETLIDVLEFVAFPNRVREKKRSIQGAEEGGDASLRPTSTTRTLKSSVADVVLPSSDSSFFPRIAFSFALSELALLDL